MRTVRLFVSSPADTAIERKLVDRVAEQLNGEAAGFVRFEVLRWENRVYGAHDTFQNLIPPTAECDIVVAIFRQRLGLALPASFQRMPQAAPFDGDPYPSGTGFEVLTALQAKADAGKPDVFVFRLSDKTPPTARLDQPEAYAEALAQWQALQGFFARFFHTPDGEFTRAYNLFADSDDFRRQATILLRDWMEENVLHQKAVAWPYKTKGSPFRSLQPFDAKHAAVYFGRDRKVGRALDAVVEAARRPEKLPFLLIVGPSGSGKSSMMRAGVAPRLTTPGVVPEVDGWRIAVLRVGDADPFAGVAASLLVRGENDDEGAFGPALPELVGRGLGASSLAAASAASGAEVGSTIVAVLDELARAQAVREGSRREMRVDLLLLVDQVESIFVAQLADERRTAFAALLQTLCKTRRIWVVATLRADLYHRFLARGAFIELADRGAQYNLAPPGDAELTEIIAKSAQAAGLVYERRTTTGERLDERLLRDAQGENMLPLLQFALDRLFHERIEAPEETRLTHAAYEAMGGIDGALEQAADRVVQRFETAGDHDAVQRLPRLLRSLAVPIRADAGGARNAGALAIRHVPQARIAADPPMRRLVDALIEARILVASVQGTGESGATDVQAGLVGVAHQKVFESWGRAREIAREHAEFFVVRDDLDRHVTAWAENRQEVSYLLPSGPRLAAAQNLVERYPDELDHPQTQAFVAASGRLALRRQRRLRVFAGAMAVLALAASAGLVGAMYFSSKAQRNYAVARDTIDGVMRDTTGQLSQLEGIRVETIKVALDVFSDAIRNLRAKSGSDDMLDRSEGEVLFNVAKLYQSAKTYDQAARYAAMSLGIRSKLTGWLAQLGPPDQMPAERAAWWWQLTESLEQVAYLERAVEKKLDAAAAKYTRSLAIRRDLVRRFPARADWPLGVSRSLVGLGDIAQDRAIASKRQPERLRHLADARSAYTQALRNTVAVAAANGGIAGDRPDALLLREIGWDLNKVGDVELRAEDFPAALDHFNDGTCLRRSIARIKPTDTLWQRDLAFALERLGAAYLGIADLGAARDAYLEALEIRDRLFVNDPGKVELLDDYGRALNGLGRFYARAMEPMKAWAYHAQAAAARRDLVNRSGDRPEPRKSLAESTAAAERLRKQVEANSSPGASPGMDFAAVVAVDRVEFRARLAVLSRSSVDCWPKLRRKLGLPEATATARARL